MKWLGLLCFFVCLFMLMPLFFVAQKGLSLVGFEALLQREDILSATGQSLLLAALVAFLSSIFGTITAMALQKMSPRNRAISNAGIVFPMILPEIAMGISFLVWYMQIGLSLGWLTLIISHIALCFSYASLIMKTRFENFDHALVEAAKDLGANSWHSFRHAFLPQVFPSLAICFVTCFALSFDDFLISFFVKGLDQLTLPVQIFSMLRHKIKPEIYSLSLLLFCLSLFVVLIMQFYLYKELKKSKNHSK